MWKLKQLNFVHHKKNNKQTRTKKCPAISQQNPWVFLWLMPQVFLRCSLQQFFLWTLKVCGLCGRWLLSSETSEFSWLLAVVWGLKALGGQCAENAMLLVPPQHGTLSPASLDESLLLWAVLGSVPQLPYNALIFSLSLGLSKWFFMFVCFSFVTFGIDFSSFRRGTFKIHQKVWSGLVFLLQCCFV